MILSQLFRLPELQLHAMACQGVGLNGGEGGNMVNPMDVSNMFPEDVVNIGFLCQVQSRCETCNCLVPDLVFDEHRQTCWAKSDTKRVISSALWIISKEFGVNYLFAENCNANGEQEKEIWCRCSKILHCAKEINSG